MATVTLQLRDLAQDGDAVGLYEGRAVLVPLGIPGETVRVELLQGRRGQARARLVEVTRPAPERVAPPCPYFGRCGGCHWQHIAYDAQLRLKRELVASRLQRIGRQPKPLVLPTIGMEDPWSYRNHVQFALDKAGRFGYQALRSHDIVPVEECAITHPLLDELWDALDVESGAWQRVSLRAGIATGEQMVILEGHDAQAPELEADIPVSCLYQFPDGEILVMAGNSFYHERLLGRTYRISGPSFFQVNTLQAERLLSIVISYLDLQPHETLLDAYGGVGAFALSLAPHAARVIGIEESPWAHADALANRTDADRVEFIQGRVEDVLPTLGGPCDAVVLDPPRSGCATRALEALARCQPGRIVYVSCDPATLARDVAQLAALGYALVEVQPVDMFPQTYHVESVALLHRQ